MNPHDAAETFSAAAFGFCDFRAACEDLRSCDEADLIIRGLDTQFKRDIARSGCASIRDLLRVQFAKLPEMLRALSEFSIVECREDAPALTLTSSGRREAIELCRIRVRSYYAAFTVAEIVRREFAARPENESPQIVIVTHEATRHAEQPPSASATAPPTASSGAPALGEVADTTPPDSGTALSSTRRPPLEPPRVFGSETTAPPLSFTTPRSRAVAAAAAAALAASEAAKREEEAAQGVYSPRLFPERTAHPFAAPPPPPSSAAPPPPPPPPRPRRRRLRLFLGRAAAARLFLGRAAAAAVRLFLGRAAAAAPLPRPRRRRRRSSSAAPPPPTSSSTTLPPSASTSSTPLRTSSSAAPPPPASGAPDTSTKSKRRASKRHPASPLQPRDAKRPAGNGSSAENPLLVDSPEKPAAESRSRFGAFEFDDDALLEKLDTCARHRRKCAEYRTDCGRSSRVPESPPDSASPTGGGVGTR